VSTRSLTPAAVESWLARYGEAWQQRDPDLAASLFTEHAAYHEMPFDAPKAGRAGIRDYWTTVTADQRNVDFNSQLVAVNGRTAVARWSASLSSASTGVRVELDGVFILTFEDSGLCSELREWWHVRTSS
jgi:ketosteroid isomerase-like protein